MKLSFSCMFFLSFLTACTHIPNNNQTLSEEIPMSAWSIATEEEKALAFLSVMELTKQDAEQKMSMLHTQNVQLHPKYQDFIARLTESLFWHCTELAVKGDERAVYWCCAHHYFSKRYCPTKPN